MFFLHWNKTCWQGFAVADPKALHFNSTVCGAHSMKRAFNTREPDKGGNAFPLPLANIFS